MINFEQETVPPPLRTSFQTKGGRDVILSRGAAQPKLTFYVRSIWGVVKVIQSFCSRHSRVNKNIG